MANEFIIKNGFQSKGDSQITGHITASGNISSSGTIIAEDANISDNLTVGGELDIADTIYHTGDSNTKIRFPENDTISFHTSGIERLNISPGGHITASGNISASGTIRTDKIIFDEDENSYIEVNDTDSIRLVAGGQQMIVFDHDTGDRIITGFGKDVGIGIGNTSTPAANLHVRGNIWASGSDNTAHITASGNISASGTFIGDGSTLTNLQRPITSSATNFSASAANAGYYFRTGGNITCSIGLNATQSIAVGTEYEFFQTASAGYLLFVTQSGVTFNSKDGKTKLAGQFSAATLKKVGTDEYDLIGDLG